MGAQGEGAGDNTPKIQSFNPIQVGYYLLTKSNYYGIFNWVADPYECPENWVRHATCKHLPVDSEGQKTTFSLIQFTGPVTSLEVLSWFKGNGFRPATLEELVEFVVHPDHEFPSMYLLALGTYAILEGDYCVPCVQMKFNERDLSFDEEQPSGWPTYYRFLAVSLAV